MQTSITVAKEAQEACRTVLVEAWQELEKHNVQGVVVGGWAAMTFNTHLPHPGTLDVDILIPMNSLGPPFQAATDALVARGFIPGAKSSFQLSKSLAVRGKQVLFHVDFLNGQNEEEAIFLERGDGTVRSIYTPVMEVVFLDEYNYRYKDIGGYSVCFPSAASFLVTKIATLGTKKRVRDPFDIFAALVDHNCREQVAREFACRSNDGLFSDAVDQLQWHFHEVPPPESKIDITAAGRTMKVLDKLVPGDYERADVLKVIDDFVARSVTTAP